MANIFYDEKTGFKMQIYFKPTLGDDFQSIVDSYKPKVAKALDLIKRMENGEIVNYTEVKAESENRMVDHYNHRHEEELVEGKSLKHTLQLWEETKKFADDVLEGKIKTSAGKKYETIIFNGIGGSYLGPLMLIIAKYGMDFNTIAKLPMKIYFISNTDSDLFHQITANIDIKTSIMVHLSKSGSTSETAGNTQTWMRLCKENNLVIGEHNAAVTIKGSLLDNIAKEDKYIRCWNMEVDTGGRTSVCSAIGMVPMAFAKMDFAEFIKGMSHMDKLTRQEGENPAALLATAIDANNHKVGHKNMIVLFYSEFMREYAHYLQQLYMESLGKEYKVDGTEARQGQTVFGGVGTGEQHSFMQQVQKGIADCFVRMMYFEKRSHDYENAQAGSMGRQLLAFLQGTQKALMQNNRSYATTTFVERNEFTFGMMIALEERVVTFLGSFFDINAYDQPGVQDGKKAATSVNATSKKIVEALAKIEGSITGPSEDIMKALKIEECPYETESILIDIVENIDVPESYPTLKGAIKAEKVWCAKHKHFHFTFSK
jgi:glucose-6-phosphate isomerase